MAGLERVDIHNSKHVIARVLKRLDASKEATPANKKAVRAFLVAIEAQGSSISRQRIYTEKLFMLSRWANKDFAKMTREDVEQLVIKYIQTPERKPWGRSIYKVVLKRFFKWLLGRDITYPPQVDWLKPETKIEPLSPDQVLTLEDVEAMIRQAPTPYWKAFVAFLFDSGARASEAMNIRLKDLHPDDKGFNVTMQGKTGKRTIRLYYCLSFLNEYFGMVSDRGPDTFLWWQKGKLPSHSYVSQYLRTLGKRAGIRKRVHLHGLRHASATYLKSLGLDPQVLCLRMGWQFNTKMMNVYVHLGNRQQDDLFFGAVGAAKPKDDPKFKSCIRCKENNEVRSQFCTKCGHPLYAKWVVEDETETASLKALAAELGPLLAALKKHPEILEKLKEE